MFKRLIKIMSLLVFLFVFMACDAHQKAIQQIPEPTEFHPVKEMVRSLQGQQVYVPVYKNLYNSEKGHIPLNTILSIRNTSLTESIIISKVDYYDTNGKLLKSYINGPFSLSKMATKDFVISSDELSGGTGANFVVKWDSEKKISTPIIEALMYGSTGTHSFSFSSRGQEIEAH